MRKILALIALSMFFSMSAMALDVSSDGPLIVNLTEDATSVIVGNPAHAAVVLDNPRVLIINARMPGMTHLTVLGEGGKVILDDTVVVNGPTKDFIRIKNACINGGNGCQPTKMFYCEDGKACSNVNVIEPVAK